jgi:hypothetical protein
MGPLPISVDHGVHYSTYEEIWAIYDAGAAGSGRMGKLRSCCWKAYLVVRGDFDARRMWVVECGGFWVIGERRVRFLVGGRG